MTWRLTRVESFHRACLARVQQTDHQHFPCVRSDFPQNDLPVLTDNMREPAASAFMQPMTGALTWAMPQDLPRSFSRALVSWFARRTAPLFRKSTWDLSKPPRQGSRRVFAARPALRYPGMRLPLPVCPTSQERAWSTGAPELSQEPIA